jgi:hypothetical protein
MIPEGVEFVDALESFVKLWEVECEVGMMQFVRENRRLSIQLLGDEPETLPANLREHVRRRNLPEARNGASMD